MLSKNMKLLINRQKSPSRLHLHDFHNEVTSNVLLHCRTVFQPKGLQWKMLNTRRNLWRRDSTVSAVPAHSFENSNLMNEVVKDQHYTRIFLMTCKLGIRNYKLRPSIFKHPPPSLTSTHVHFLRHLCHIFETKSDFIIIKWQLWIMLAHGLWRCLFCWRTTDV